METPARRVIKFTASSHVPLILTTTIALANLANLASAG